jgi:hypothetical protein
VDNVARSVFVHSRVFVFHREKRSDQFLVR